MQKLKFVVLDKLILNRCTSAEINAILHMSRYQDECGHITGIYYRDICFSLGISIQKFYDLKTALIKKHIIKAEKSHFSDWEITILDNDFSYPESYKEGYLNTSHAIFSNKSFLKLKAGEKLLAMQLLKISFSGRGSYNIGVDKFYKKYTEILGVTKRIIQDYLTSLRFFFSIGVKEHQYWITPLAKVYKSKTLGDRSPSEAEVLNQHIGDTICRREKISFTKQALKDSINLIKQYQTIAKEQIIPAFIQAVRNSIQTANKNIKNIRNWKRELQPKLVHKMLKEIIRGSC